MAVGLILRASHYDQTLTCHLLGDSQQAGAGFQEKILDDGALWVVRVEWVLRAAEAGLDTGGQVL